MSILRDPLDAPIDRDQQIDTPLHQPPRRGLYEAHTLDHPPHTLDGHETVPYEVPACGLSDRRTDVNGEADVAEDVVPFLNPLYRSSAVESHILPRVDERRIRGRHEWGRDGWDVDRFEGGHHGRQPRG